jgi:hypothetical protein
MTDTTTIDPAIDPAALTPGDPPPADPAPELPLEQPPQPKMIPVETLIREITPLRSSLREIEAQLAAERRRNQESAELIARLQQNPGEQTPPAAPRQEQMPATDIDRRAAEMLFQRDAAAISETAYKSYGQGWVNSVNLLNSLGLNSGDFVSNVMDVVGREHTHEVMHQIAQNPEQAAALASMSPARRIAEITRISMTPAAKPVEPPAAPATPPARTVSRAPNPPPKVEPSATREVDWRSDEATDAEFDRGFQEMVAKRNARR